MLATNSEGIGLHKSPFPQVFNHFVKIPQAKAVKKLIVKPVKQQSIVDTLTNEVLTKTEQTSDGLRLVLLTSTI